MYVIFKKGYLYNKKWRVIGSVAHPIVSKAKELIDLGVADPYRGEVPPKKHKTDFFKPK